MTAVEVEDSVAYLDAQVCRLIQRNCIFAGAEVGRSTATAAYKRPFTARERFPMSWGLVRHALNEGGERASVNVEIDRPSGEAVQSSTRTAVLVLGMHRSGTSSLAGTLVKLGGTAPLNLVPADPDNTRGFWESLGPNGIE